MIVAHCPVDGRDWKRTISSELRLLIQSVQSRVLTSVGAVIALFDSFARVLLCIDVRLAIRTVCLHAPGLFYGRKLIK